MASETAVAGPDYPAAHSMDTIWYGVDSHGEIAKFDSGEDGAVPKHAANSWHNDFQYIEDSLLQHAAEGKITADFSDIESLTSDDIENPPFRPRVPHDGWLYKALGWSKYRNIAPCLVVLRPGYKDLKLKWKPLAIISQGGLDLVFFGYTDTITVEDFRKLNEANLVEKSLFWGVSANRDWTAPWRFGIYSFDHDEDSPLDMYERMHVPQTPATIANLPEKLKAQAKTFHVNARFSDAEKLSLRQYCDDLETYGGVPVTDLDEYYRENQQQEAGDDQH